MVFIANRVDHLIDTHAQGFHLSRFQDHLNLALHPTHQRDCAHPPHFLDALFNDLIGKCRDFANAARSLAIRRFLGTNRD